MSGPTCIECGGEGKLVGGKRVYPHRPDLYSLRFYLCDCGAYCGTHKGTTDPLGYPCGPETRRARSAAHRAFDPLWRGKGARFRRNEAYAWLAEKMGMSRDDCHIGMMTADQARQVVRIVKARAAPQRRRRPTRSAFMGKTLRTSNWQGAPTGPKQLPWCAS